MASERSKAESLSAAERDRLIAENNRLRQELQERYGLSNIVGNSRGMRVVCEQIGQAARADAPVLIRGEPGTGKTLVARAIHHNSARSRRPFIRLKCAGQPEAVVESQLFGEASAARTLAGTGVVHRAGRGTLFFEEIGELGLSAQDRLLSILRDRAYEPPAGGRVRTDVRLIAATSVNLEEAAAAGGFRRDFYQRLSILTIGVPPLRERKADLPMLVDLLVEKYAREHVRRVGGFSMRAMDLLLGYDWPGNARELSTVIERAVVLAAGPVIHHHVLPAAIREAAGSSAGAPVGLIEALDAYEGELLRDALKQARGVRSRAARLLRTTERIFSYKLRKHGIDCRQFKITG